MGVFFCPFPFNLSLVWLSCLAKAGGKLDERSLERINTLFESEGIIVETTAEISGLSKVIVFFESIV